jgi:glycosyltransferase involved in cell wall biosynthesis
MEKLAAVLFLHYTSDSILYRPYLDFVGPTNLLEWFIDRFISANPTVSLYVLVQGDADLQLVSDKVHYIKTDHKTKLSAFAQAARDVAKPCIAFLTLGFGFAPRSLLEYAYSHHISSGNNFTPIRGLPNGAIPEVYDSDLLLSLQNLNFPFLPPDPVVIIDRLSKIASSTGETPIPIRAQVLDAAALYNVDPVELPECVLLESSRDIDVARRAITALSALNDEGAANGLRCWKQAAIEERLNFRGGLARAINIENDFKKRTTPRRILYVSNPSAFSGAEESLCQLISRLDTDRYQPFALIGLRGVYSERLKSLGVSVICPDWDFGVNTLDSFLYLLNTVHRVQPDIIHLNGISGFPIMFVAASLGIPTILHLRSVCNTGMAEQLRCADSFIAVSEFVKREAAKLNIVKDMIYVIKNGIDTCYFRKDIYNKIEMRQEFGLPFDSKVVLMIARFAPYKRHDSMLKAADIIRKSVPSFHLIVVGEALGYPEYYESIQRATADLNLNDFVTFIGFQTDIRMLEAAADVLVSCSDGEPLSRCIIEAMAMQLPVVAVNSGGTPEIIKDKKTGFIVESGDPAKLAERIIEALTMDELCTQIVKNARTFVERELDASMCANRTMEIYDLTLSKRQNQQ